MISFRPQCFFSAVLCGICVAFVWGVASRDAVRLDVMRDRSVLAREVDDGQIENAYTLQLMSVAETSLQVELSVTGLDGARLVGEHSVVLNPAATKAVTVQVRVPADSLAKGAHKVFFELRSDDSEIVLREKSTFLMP